MSRFWADGCWKLGQNGPSPEAAMYLGQHYHTSINMSEKQKIVFNERIRKGDKPYSYIRKWYISISICLDSLWNGIRVYTRQITITISYC